MNHNPQRHHRRSIRLKGYDYAQACAYFVTICAQDRECLFGEIIDANMRLSDGGLMVEREWDALPDRFPSVQLDALVIMPNHIHGIIVLAPDGPNDHTAESATTAGQTMTTVGQTMTTAGQTMTTVGQTMTTVGQTMTTVDQSVGAPLVGALPGRGLGAHKGCPYNSQSDTLGEIVGAFKSLTTVVYTRGVRQSGWPGFRGRLWQRNYYEHIIRSETELDRISEYIASNPARWDHDDENPLRIGR